MKRQATAWVKISAGQIQALYPEERLLKTQWEENKQPNFLNGKKYMDGS